jgi:hypothetical protein
MRCEAFWKNSYEVGITMDMQARGSFTPGGVLSEAMDGMAMGEAAPRRERTMAQVTAQQAQALHGDAAAGGASGAAPIKVPAMATIEPCASELRVTTHVASLEQDMWQFQVVHMQESCHLWIGMGDGESAPPVMGNLVVAMTSTARSGGGGGGGRGGVGGGGGGGGVSSATSLVSGGNDEFTMGMAKRLSKRLGKVVYVSCGAPLHGSSQELFLEKCCRDILEKGDIVVTADLGLDGAEWDDAEVVDLGLGVGGVGTDGGAGGAARGAAGGAAGGGEEKKA